MIKKSSTRVQKNDRFIKPSEIKNHKIQLLPQAEISTLYDLPRFTSLEERDFFFATTDKEIKAMSSYNTTKTKLYFLLQLGYFKATKQFYSFSFEDVVDDIKYLVQIHFPGKTIISLQGSPSKKNIYAQKLKILSLFKYQEWNKKAKGIVEKRLLQLMRTHPRHQDSLRELLTFLDAKRILIPSYRTLQELFSKAITQEASRLNTLMTKLLSKSATNALDKFLEKLDTTEHLTLLKADQKNFSFTALKKEIRKLEQIEQIYILGQKIIPKLKISKNCVHYYCDLVDQLTIYRLSQFKKFQARAYLLCYIYYRYEQISDYLIISFQYHVYNLLQKAKEYVDKKEQEYNNERNLNLPNVSNLLRLMVSDKIEKSSPYYSFLESAFKILPENQFLDMADFLDNKTFDRESTRWSFFGQSARKISMYLRGIVLVIDFSHLNCDSELMRAITVIKKHYKKNKAPSKLDLSTVLGLVPTNKRSCLYCCTDNKITIDPARFEFFVYEKMLAAVEAGTLFCNKSLSFKDLNQDFSLGKKLTNKEKIAKNLGYPRLINFAFQRLNELDEELHQAWLRTNYNIDKGQNSSIKIIRHGENITWQLKRPKATEDDAPSIFDKLHQVEISDVVYFIFKKCNVLKAFTHIKPYRSKRKPTIETILACIFADAFGCGINKMAEMSDLDINQLRFAHYSTIRLETLKKANDCVVNFIAELPLFKHWNIVEEKLLADVDGQKFESRFQTVQARCSSKYFALNKGIVSYTLIANNVPANSRIISPNQHESHFTFDLIYNNTSNIELDMVTGDTHSVNQLNFFILDMINVSFVPNYKDIAGKATSIYCMRDPKQYKGLIKPAGQININLIKEQKENIQLMLFSLVLQETTQSIIVRKLASHKRYGRLKKALWEYNKILRSIHLLNLIDDATLRSHLKTARNRTESYHQLQSRIRRVHGGKFRGRTIAENEIWNQAARLIANCIIAYNGIILSALYETNKGLLKIIKKISPVAWQHINLAGRYTFKEQKKTPNIANITQILETAISTTFKNEVSGAPT